MTTATHHPIGVNHDVIGLINALRNPASYPHPAEYVRVLQTHTSCVFLTGDFAYKIKKPVQFTFLDYGTLDNRLFYLQEEIRLNGTLCPDIYLDVVPITRQDGAVTIDGDGEVIEWAVRMRQLRDEDILANRLITGKVEREDIEQIAKLLAYFHTGAFRDSIDGDFGTPKQIEHEVADACRTMDFSIEGNDWNSRYLIRPYLENFIAQHADLFWDRIHQDKIRDCHGDLRTRNVCLDERYGDGIQLFDCIEFSHDLRFIDTAADIAYLAMDLDLAGRRDLSDILIDTYQEVANDDDLCVLLPFYQTYRAVIRGNIAVLAASEIEMPEPDRDRNTSIAAAAYDLARCYSGERTTPALMITVGYSGSGKSTLAREISRRLPAILLSSDEIRKELVDQLPCKGDLYSPANRTHVYDELRHRAIYYLTSHISSFARST